MAVLVRYRSAIPAMFALLALNFLAAQVLHWYYPTVREAPPIVLIVNRVVFALMVAGLLLSLWNRPNGDSKDHRV